MEHEIEHPHVLSRSAYVAVWAALICLTGVTVGSHSLELRHLAILTIMIVATVKSSLVLLYFMHVRFEKPIVPIMILVTLATYAVFVILTFSDYSFR